MKQFLSLFQQDFKVTIRNAFIYILLALVVIIIALVFFLPETMNMRSPEFFFDASEGKLVEKALLAAGMDAENVVESQEALLTALEESKKGIGIVFQGSLENPQFTLYTEGPVAKENLNLIEAILEQVVAELSGEKLLENYSVKLLRGQSEPIPLNQNIVPIFLVLDAALLGYMISSVIIFQEKEEGTLRALRVTPMTPLVYIGSKTVLYVLMGLAYGAPAVLAARGFSANYLNLLIVLSLFSVLMTLLGISIAVFFRNMSEWLFGGVFVLILMILPSISYGIPAFAPTWITCLPTFPVIFAVRDAMFYSASLASIGSVVWMLLLEIALMLVVCYMAVSRKLLRDG